MGKNKSEDNVPRITESPINFSMTVASTIAGLCVGYCNAQGIPINVGGRDLGRQLLAVPVISKSIAGGVEGLLQGPTIHTGNSLGDRVADASMSMGFGALAGLGNGVLYFAIGYVLGYAIGSLPGQK